MATNKVRPPPAQQAAAFDLQAFLHSLGIDRTLTKYATSAIIFSQGSPATDVFYLQQGSVKLSVVSQGKKAVVAILGPGDFFGEGCLAGQRLRMTTAFALSASTVLVVEQPLMLEMLRRHPSLADRFLSHMLTRNLRIEADLVDHLFDSSEKRLARILLRLARYGTDEQPTPLPKLSQKTLAEMVGTTRSRVNFFMNKFRELGFIEYNGDIKVNKSLLTVVLHDRGGRG